MPHSPPDRIEALVRLLWPQKWWAAHVSDLESQQDLIALRQQKYLYPAYADLVGAPSPTDYGPDGELTTTRKARLLLLGELDWQGLRIARHYQVTAPEQAGWFVRLDQAGAPVAPNLPAAPNFLELVNNWPAYDRLEHHLVARARPLLGDDRVVHKDGNPYNNMPINLELDKDTHEWARGHSD